MKIVLSAALFLAALAAAPQVPAQTSANAPPARDRQAILAMAGDYRVRFDFRETIPLREGYQPIPPSGSGGFEAVRVIEDRGDFISLQHILVVGDEEGPDSIVKHWRQDWRWQPADVLTYISRSVWKYISVPQAERRGAWSQTVYQTDDSPRYGGVGRWTYRDGVTRWTSEATRRPLARRDAIRNPPYAWYDGFNRHTLTPTGWVHEQDNVKAGMLATTPTAYVQEQVVNTYTRSKEFKASLADTYWAQTKDYWASVRAAWESEARKTGGLHVTEEANRGSITGAPLMDLADEIAKGEKQTPGATADARRIIAAENARLGSRAGL